MENKPLGQYKLSEGKQVLKRVPTEGFNLFKRYLSHYFESAKPSSKPIFHGMLLLGAFGYMLEYSHLSMKFFNLIEHERDGGHH